MLDCDLMLVQYIPPFYLLLKACFIFHSANEVRPDREVILEWSVHLADLEHPA